MKPATLSVRTIVITYVALIVFALGTWGLAQVRLGPPWVNDVVALVIALIKGGLVVAIFMELKHERKLAKLWAGAGVGFLLILSMILSDYFTRAWDPRPHNWNGEEGRMAGSIPDGGAPTPSIYHGRENDR